MKNIPIYILMAITFFSCKKEVEQKPVEEIKMPSAINLSLMDTTIRPQDDFYNFVNGNWMKNTKIPSDRGSWGSFYQLREYTDSTSLVLLKKTLTQSFDEGTDERKVSDFYKTIMDTVARNNAGLAPIKSHLDSIENMASVQDLHNYLVKETVFGGNPIYGFYVRPHMKKSSVNSLYLSSPDLGMSRDYYLKDDEESKNKLLAYQGYIKEVLSYIGDENAEVNAAEILNFEKKLAQNLLPIEDTRNADLQYNPYTIEALQKAVPAIDFSHYFSTLGVKADSLIISEKKYYQNISSLLNETNLPTIKKFLKFNLVNKYANVLNTDLEKLSFNFYDKELNGVQEMRARDKRALETVNRSIGQAFGKLYVAEYFPQEAKEKAEEMVRYVRKSFENHIKDLSWMSDSTKTKALKKLEKFNVKIGFPDQWKDYSALEITGTENGSFFQNMRNIAAWNFKENVEKIGKDVDKSEWFMPPQMVNAYYSSSFNEIVFPAAILQPPFYNFKADAAVNFGGMGAVIGHEISHGFDDSGAKYDGDGNLNNWWSAQDKNSFGELGSALSGQYNAYEPLEGIFVNGESTLGENIADLGGVNVAYDALQMYLKDKGNPGKIDNFTPEQRFFISWATIWRSKATDEFLKNQVKSDYHSPGYFRAIGPLENIDAFYDAFSITEKDSMYKPKDKRIVIW